MTFSKTSKNLHFFLGFWDPEASQESLKRPKKAPRGSQRLPEAPRGSRGSQTFPEAPRDSRGSQRLPEASRGSQEVPRDSQRLPGDSRGSQRLPEARRGSQRLPGLPEAPRGRWTRLWEIHKIAIRGTVRSQPPRRSSWQARL